MKFSAANFGRDRTRFTLQIKKGGPLGPEKWTEISQEISQKRFFPFSNNSIAKMLYFPSYLGRECSDTRFWRKFFSIGPFMPDIRDATIFNFKMGYLENGPIDFKTTRYFLVPREILNKYPFFRSDVPTRTPRNLT